MPIRAHDNFIKQLLSHKELAVDFLKEYLPGSLVKIIDFKTLTHQDTSYINENLKASFSDLVWSVEMHEKKKLRISLLLEHKSYADPEAAFQLLDYLASGYRKQIKEKKKAEPIIPILYYHGKAGWTFKTLDTYFSGYPDLIQPYLPSFATEFVNLRHVSAEQIRALTNGLLTSAILYQKYYFDPEGLKANFHAILENLIPYLGLNITYSIFVYILQGPYLDSEFIKESIKNLSGDMSTRMMTAYDQLIAEGMQRGKEQGMAEGHEKALVQTILNAHDNGIDLATIRAITGESEEKVNFILRKNRRIK
ncbi:MAG: Rpn family recombination-promoting nuclease/putative transposase [Leadbetterella sp.]|nr:Rpn family recombination-promoting nuclease/putative transposase [Leadbetterella sp.]